MKKFAILILSFVLITAVSASAQMVDKADIQAIKSDYLGLKPATKPFALIDLSRIKWSNSYTLSFFSGGGQSGSLGHYQTSLFYEFSSSLALNLNLGILHDPGSLFDRRANSQAAYLPGFLLDYHPSPNFRIALGMQSVPASYYLYQPFYVYPWRYDR